MIPNLKSKLSHLPKVEVEKANIVHEDSDFHCSRFENSYDINFPANEYILSSFASCNISALKKACMIHDEIDIRVDEIIFFDTETTGLSGGTGTVAFLVGVGRLVNNKFVVKQFLMNDYHQENDLLNEFVDTLKGAKAVITYNGKSFDAPLLKTRSILNRIELGLEKYIHFDLLHACRRLYATRIQRCKLTDIEEKILNITRVDDIPGSEIPELFFRYLKCKDMNLLDKVVEHNLFDILSLVQIAGELAKSYEHPDEVLFAEDRYGIARTLHNYGSIDRAERIFKTLKQDYEPARVAYAFIQKKKHKYKEAIEEFIIIANHNRFNIIYDIEVAKIAEHHMKDYELALQYTANAKEKINKIRLLNIEYNIIDDVENRRKRILKKMGRI
ncbi:MAG: ribonuclease H-like domain-containing protein [Clostridiales bacterium]|nr:ribonuclease H-like domain-containing protein [Clostridiales bacterium]